MSVRLMARVWEMDGLPGHLKLLLLRLADHANDDGRCYPGQESLSEAVSSSERNVRRNLETLRRLGVVEVVARRRRASQEYQLCLPADPSSLAWEDMVEDLTRDAELTFEVSDQDRTPTTGLGEQPTTEPADAADDPVSGQDRTSTSAYGQVAKGVVVPDQDRTSTAGLIESQDRTSVVGKTGRRQPLSKKNHHEPSVGIPLASLEGPRADGSEKPIHRQLWDALEAAGFPKVTNKLERGKWNGAIGALLESKATPAEVVRRARVYRERWVPRLEYTPAGLAANWSRFASEGPATVTPIAEPDCDACGNSRLVGFLADGSVTSTDDPDGTAAGPCPMCRPRREVVA